MNALYRRYEKSLLEKMLLPDAAQEKAVKALDTLVGKLTRKKSFSLFKRRKPVKGLYLYGSVGRGKTMMMDWCLTTLREHNVAVERRHFHAFMLEVHRSLRDQKTNSAQLDNRIEILADRWADRLEVLCFDEFHVTDVADAMIMMPLFTRLFERGVTVIATSNWKPEDLYTGGLQRQRFLPFIDILKIYMDILSVDGEHDYRTLKATTMQGWLTPLNASTEEDFDILFRDAVGYDPIETHEIHVQGRTWVVPRASKSVALLDMSTLLNQALGAADFLALADRYQIVFLDKLSPFDSEGNERAKRFMVMIDAFYDRGLKLVVRADVPAEKLYPENGRLGFEFTRTLSRLKEMTNVKIAASA